MSGTVGIVAIIPVANGKFERMQELFEEMFKYFKANEPGTLEFAVYKQQTEHGTSLLLQERYADQEALTRHQSSDNYKNVFKQMSDEKLLAGEPTMAEGSWLQALQR